MIKLTWVDIGMATAPGRYDSRYGVIEVTSDDLWIWQKYPNAAFVVMQPSPFSDESVSRLGTFELRENWNVPGHEKGDGPSNAGDEAIDDRKGRQTEAVASSKPDASDLIYLDHKPSVEAPSSAAEPAKETTIEPRERSAEPLDDLQKRIEALIKGSD